MNEVGWLIETARTTYWDGRGLDEHCFTDNHNDAVRFSRFQDAEVIRCWFLGKIGFSLRSTWHRWGLNEKTVSGSSDLLAETIRALRGLVQFTDRNANYCFCDQWKDPIGLQHSGACLDAQDVLRKADDVELLRPIKKLEQEIADLEAANRILSRTCPECPACGHAWIWHNPETGRCGERSHYDNGTCECGGSIGFHQMRNRELACQFFGLEYDAKRKEPPR